MLRKLEEKDYLILFEKVGFYGIDVYWRTVRGGREEFMRGELVFEELLIKGFIRRSGELLEFRILFSRILLYS